MRRWAAICIILAGLSAPSAARAAPAEDPLQGQLDQNLQTARWMTAYDHVAWATTDLLLKESRETVKLLGPVWFCIEMDHVWYAAYGRMQADAFTVVCCYRQSAKDTYEKVSPPDFADKDRFGRAISLTLPEILEVTRRYTVRFNYYIRRERDGIALYYVPALQTDGKLAYGIEHTYFLDATGAKVAAHERCGHVLVGALPNKERTIMMEMPECPLPTPQAIFMMMSYRDQFADILTHCQDGYFGMAVQNGALRCIRTSALSPNPPSPTSQAR